MGSPGSHNQRDVNIPIYSEQVNNPVFGPQTKGSKAAARGGETHPGLLDQPRALACPQSKGVKPNPSYVF